MTSKAKVSYTLTVVGIVICIEQYLLGLFFSSPFTRFGNDSPVEFGGLISNLFSMSSIGDLCFGLALQCASPIALFLISRSILLKSVLLGWFLLLTNVLVQNLLHMGEFKAGSLRAPIYESRVVEVQLTYGACVVMLLITVAIAVAKKVFRNTGTGAS